MSVPKNWNSRHPPLQQRSSECSRCLTPVEREVLTLHYAPYDQDQHHSFDEIAERLGITARAMRQKSSRASSIEKNPLVRPGDDRRDESSSERIDRL